MKVSSEEKEDAKVVYNPSLENKKIQGRHENPEPTGYSFQRPGKRRRRRKVFRGRGSGCWIFRKFVRKRYMCKVITALSLAPIFASLLILCTLWVEWAPANLFHAIIMGDIETVRWYLEVEDQDLEGVVKISQNRLRTLLHVAVEYNQSGIARYLLFRGASVEGRDVNDWTPLHYAALTGSVEMIETLVKTGADVEAHDSLNRSPLHIAAIQGTVEAADSLVKAGAGLFALDKEGATAYMYSTMRSDTRISDFLLSKQQDAIASGKADFQSDKHI